LPKTPWGGGSGVISRGFARRLIAGRPWSRFDGAMPRDPFVREKFIRERTAAKKLAAE
jgi:hypothetical protein